LPSCPGCMGKTPSHPALDLPQSTVCLQAGFEAVNVSHWLEDTIMLESQGSSDCRRAADIHAEKLKSLLQDDSSIYACVRDLLENGPTATAYWDANYRPSRSDITHYLAKWLKSINVAHARCLEWLSPYALDVLSVISKSSQSQIRHNTKSIIKYIYNSDVRFDCLSERNVIRARCEPDCPIYNMIPERPALAVGSSAVPGVTLSGTESEDAPETQTGRVKDGFREQFEKAMSYAREHLAKGLSTKRVLRLLNDEGFRTRTGKVWTASILGNELRKSEKEATDSEE
jgi:hypothetical protein